MPEVREEVLVAGKLDVLLAADKVQAPLLVQALEAPKSTQRETRLFEERERTDRPERWHESTTLQSTVDH